MEKEVYEPGQIIIRKGETSRDLYFLYEGVLEVSTGEKNGDFVLSELEPPQIFGDIAFFYGLPRTGTVKAKTRAEVFVLRFTPLKDQHTELPAWLKPILNKIGKRLKDQKEKIRRLEREIEELKEKLSNR